jgi:hypothetical protein
MNALDHLLPSIDNGGRRAYLKRRCNNRFRVITPRRTNPDRRSIVDRRKIPNEKRMNGYERREVF